MNKKDMYGSANDIITSHTTHPGVMLAEELEARTWTQADLVKATGLSKSIISLIIAEERSILPKTALLLEQALNIDARFWLNLQNRFDLVISMQSLRELRKAAI